MDIKLITVEKIKPNSYNPNVVEEPIMAKLRQEIGQKGLCAPIIVRGGGDAYEIVDGEHRWRICRELGWKEVPCIIQDYDNKEAKIKTLQLNYMRGAAVPIKLAHLIHDLSKEIKLEDLAKKLPYETPQMLDNLELLKLPDDFGKDIENKAKEEEKELPSVVSFVLYRKQQEVVEKAINIAAKDLPDGTKNQKAWALERICAYFLTGQGVKNKDESPRETKKTP